MTAVRPPARFGRLEIEDEQVVSFAEKPQMSEGWINGAFFVLEPGVFDYIDGDVTQFEREPLEQPRPGRPAHGLPARGLLAVHGHRCATRFAWKSSGRAAQPPGSYGAEPMRVLVTGHDGYIGHVLVPMLQSAGHEVTGLDSGLFDGLRLPGHRG